ncbi:ankyrin [Aspergillus steynii IBT 23096]|uniref:Ankyrin n=1 Tax=Aspergillus steynii IBT 23096 TaxID=1392250 RepID=A0A2I2G143_9EURO|nr:ankyrin [Aspergillus steynii IBT 23096]PLB46597.1 ankyrin [Aspergillus steynii IBT 23096]
MTLDYQSFADAFFEACDAGDLQKTQEGLKSGRLTAEDLEEGLTSATEMAYSDLVAAFFNAGARVTPKTMHALPGYPGVEQKASVIRHYLDHGLDPNGTCRSDSPLLVYVSDFWAEYREIVTDSRNSEIEDPGCARELILAGADPNRAGRRGLTPLTRAIGSRKGTSLAEMLLAHGARLEPELLFTAVDSRMPLGELMTKFLLEKGLDPNMTSAEWGNPLHCAIYSAKPGAVEALLDAGADPTGKSAHPEYRGRSPLQMAQGIIFPERRQAILSLLESRGVGIGGGGDE